MRKDFLVTWRMKLGLGGGTVGSWGAPKSAEGLWSSSLLFVMKGVSNETRSEQKKEWKGIWGRDSLEPQISTRCPLEKVVHSNFPHPDISPPLHVQSFHPINWRMGIIYSQALCWDSICFPCAPSFNISKRVL